MTKTAVALLIFFLATHTNAEEIVAFDKGATSDAGKYYEVLITSTTDSEKLSKFQHGTREDVVAHFQSLDYMSSIQSIRLHFDDVTDKLFKITYHTRNLLSIHNLYKRECEEKYINRFEWQPASLNVKGVSLDHLISAYSEKYWRKYEGPIDARILYQGYASKDSHYIIKYKEKGGYKLTQNEAKNYNKHQEALYHLAKSLSQKMYPDINAVNYIRDGKPLLYTPISAVDFSPINLNHSFQVRYSDANGIIGTVHFYCLYNRKHEDIVSSLFKLSESVSIKNIEGVYKKDAKLGYVFHQTESGLSNTARDFIYFTNGPYVVRINANKRLIKDFMAQMSNEIQSDLTLSDNDHANSWALREAKRSRESLELLLIKPIDWLYDGITERHLKILNDYHGLRNQKVGIYDELDTLDRRALIQKIIKTAKENEGD